MVENNCNISIVTNHNRVLDKCYYEFYSENLKDEDYVQHPGDGFKNKNFKNKIYSLKPGKIKILDLGCGHGEAIEDFIDDNHLAIGVDGNPMFSKYLPSWKKYPKNFFICDLGKDFTLLDNNETVKFDVIMSWECLEHIKTDDVDLFLKNIKKHSKNETIYVFSIGITQDPTHRTIKSRRWWIDKFRVYGWSEINLNFSQDELIRNLPGLSHYFFMNNSLV